MYKVIRYFTDLQDNDFPYKAGDTFPRDGKKVTASRIAELSSSANLQGVPLIEEVRGADETATLSKMETIETADNSVPVDDEPPKRGRKRNKNE